MDASARRAVVAAVECLAELQDGVVSRRQAAELGADKERVACEVTRGRWAARGRHSIAVHRGPLPEPATWRVALFEVGSAAALDGVSALRAAGLDGYENQIQVSVAHGSHPARRTDIQVREMLPWHESDVVGVGLRRTKPHIAAVRAAAWAQTDRQAALILLMTSQQRLARPQAMADYAEGLLRLRRRRVITSVLREAVSGVSALGELDFARLCRRRGLPEPSRQVMRKSGRRRVYLDVEWEDLGVVVEIDGGHHLEPLHSLDDSLRQNDVTIGHRIVLRVPCLGLILDEDRFMAQVVGVVNSRLSHRC